MDALDRDQAERFVDFTDKATGWIWVLVPVLPVLCALYTAARMNRSRSVLATKEPEV